MNDDGRRGVASRPGILPAKRGDRGCCPGRETSSAAASALPCGCSRRDLEFPRYCVIDVALAPTILVDVGKMFVL